MAHKMMINGTVREAAGGKMMINGTVRNVAKGKAMINGTVREIAFGGGTFTVQITKAGEDSHAYVEINGKKYYSVTTIECEAGTTLKVYSGGNNYQTSTSIRLNGTTVAKGTLSEFASYSFVPDASIVKIAFTKTTNYSFFYYRTDITTE